MLDRISVAVFTTGECSRWFVGTPHNRLEEQTCGERVKSMSGEQLEVAKLGWHGLDGERRPAFRRIDDRNGFPWLTSSKHW